MNGFYISVSNGLISKEHRDRIGSAIWEFMWCLDKVTKIDQKGIGWVLGGKPIKLSEVGLGVSEDTVSRNLSKLSEEGYLQVIRTPYGLSLRVNKAKKRFYKNAVSEEGRNRKSAESITSDINAESLRKSAVSNKTVSVDSIRTDKEAETSSADIVDVIDCFAMVNKGYKSWFANRTQRSAVIRLIKAYGKEKVLQVVCILPRTNEMQYIPTVTTPLQLDEKWAQLEVGLKKKKEELKSKKPNVVFS